MANGTQAKEAVPDWLAAVKAEAAAAAADPERIPLRTSAPVPRGPGKDEAPSEKKPTDTRRLSALDNELIDVKKSVESKKEIDEPKPPSADMRRRLNAATPKAPAPASEPGIERDLDRPRYPSRLMVPSTVAMAAAGTAWVMYAMPWIPTKFQTVEMYAAIPGAIFLFQLVKWAYRVLSGGYRLTKTQLIQFAPGPIPDPDPIDLTTIAGITVKQSTYEWFLLAGTLQLNFERDGHKDVTLGPVSWPKRRVRLMQHAIDAARDGKVVAGRVAA